MDLIFMSTLNLPTTTQSELIKIVLDYLKGTSILHTKKALHKACRVHKHDADTMFDSISVTPELLEEICTLLNIPRRARQNYREEQTLSTLLVRLHQDGYGHKHLAFLLQLIQESRYILGWTKSIAAGSIIVLVTGIFSYVYRNNLIKLAKKIIATLPRLLSQWFKKTSMLFRNMPLISIAYTSAVMLWDIYSTFYYGFNNLREKAASLFFNLSSNGLSLSGYIVSFLAAGVVTPLASALFAASSAVDVAESVVTYLIIRFHTLPKRSSLANTWEAHADYIRHKNLQHHAGRTVWVKLAAAILITTIAAAWLIFPPTIILAVVCTALTVIISLTKMAILRHLDTVSAKNLQHELHAFTQSYEKGAQTPQSTHGLFASFFQSPTSTAKKSPTMPPKPTAALSFSSLQSSLEMTFFGQKATTVPAADTPQHDHQAAYTM